MNSQRAQIFLMIGAFLLTSTAHAAKVRVPRDRETGFTLKSIENLNPETRWIMTEMAESKNKFIDPASSQMIDIQTGDPKNRYGLARVLRVEENGNSEILPIQIESGSPAKSIFASSADDEFRDLKAFRLNKDFKDHLTSRTVFVVDQHGIKMAQTVKYEISGSNVLNGEVKLVPDAKGKFENSTSLEIILNRPVDGSWVPQRNMIGHITIPKDIPRAGQTRAIRSFELNGNGTRLTVRTSDGVEYEYPLKQDFENRKVEIERNPDYQLYNPWSLMVRRQQYPGRSSVGAPDAFDGLKMKKAGGAQ